MTDDVSYIIGPNGHNFTDQPLSSVTQFTRLPPPPLPGSTTRGKGPGAVGGRGPGEHWIPDGERNTTLTSLAGTMRRTGMGREAMTVALLVHNRDHCLPPLPEDEVRKIAESVSQYPPGEAPRSKQGPSQSSRLVKLAAEAGVELLHHEDEAFATFRVRGHRETHPLRSKDSRNLLAWLYYKAEAGGAVCTKAMQDALNQLEAKARFEGAKIPVHTRLAEHGGAIFLDLCNDEWEVVKIDANGWALVTDPPVRFRRKKGMEPLPRPVRGGSLDELRPFVNTWNDNEWRLLVAWLVAALRPRGPYPVLNLTGEQGCAKSTTARVLRLLVDPNKAALRSLPNNDRDLMIAATNGWVNAFDNLSTLPPPSSDALCRLASGAGHASRSLYTDDEEALFSAARPIILTGIGDVVTRPDLLDRSLMLSLPSVEHKRRPEDEFWADFAQAQPRILGALLDAVSAAVRNLPTTRLEHLPRMADFARWATAAEPALGWPAGSFMAAYEGNREEADNVALSASSLAGAVLKLVGTVDHWEGTATELLKELEAYAGPDVIKQKDFPKNNQALSNELRRINPPLRKAGVAIDFSRGKRRLISIRRTDQNHQDEVTSVADGLDDGLRVSPTGSTPLTTGCTTGCGPQIVPDEGMVTGVADGLDGFRASHSPSPSVATMTSGEGCEKEGERRGSNPSNPSLPSAGHPVDLQGFWVEVREVLKRQKAIQTCVLLEAAGLGLVGEDLALVRFEYPAHAKLFTGGNNRERLAKALEEVTGRQFRVEVEVAANPTSPN